MAGFGTMLPSRFADLLAKFAGADGSKVSAQIVADDAEAMSINLSMSAGETEHNEQTELSTQLEAEIGGVKISAASDAANSGETASTSLKLNADVQEGELAEAKVIAEAKGDEAYTTAAAITDPELNSNLIVEQDTVKTLGDNNLPVESRTDLQVWTEGLASDPPPSSEENAPVETGNADWLFS